MSINIKVRYRVLMTHGLSYDIESQNTNLTLLICQPEPSLRSPSLPLVSLKTLLRVRPSLLFWHPPFNHAHYQ